MQSRTAASTRAIPFLLSLTLAFAAAPAIAQASQEPPSAPARVMPVVGGLDHPWSMAFLPDGDLALLERWYKPWRGVGMRIRRVPGRSIRPGAVLDGNYLVEADLGQEIDNMEGLCVHQGGGKTVLTLISDDNFSFLQRTVLLEFELAST